MTESALVSEGSIREEMFAQRRSRLGTQEVKRILGRRTCLTKEGEGILGRVGVGRDREVFPVVGVGMSKCAVREGAEVTKEPTRVSPDTNRQAPAIE